MRFQPLLTLDDLAALLVRSPNTIRKDMWRNPTAVPPRMILPNSNMLRWRPEDVERWIEQLVEPPVSALDGGLQ
jgi:hypothetical protein